MSADVLRRAAALMRERAEAATAEDHVGDSWEAVAQHDAANKGWRIDYRPEVDGFDSTIAQTPYDYDGSLATHIASWHPAVALAVADWIDATARGVEREGLARARDTQAFVVARAYLGEDA